ncbi:MAG: hypothetical protein Ct9H300mP13_3440 [Gammaproteobacteria bacterium]|nr:MAG: hypothetical protein Ct9H300mP13_3440 [Gammaproteobacteria bacterium]
MPGQDDDFVMGMRMIQDREKIVRSFLKGHGQVGNDHPISPAYGAIIVMSCPSGLMIRIRPNGISTNPAFHLLNCLLRQCKAASRRLAF